LLELLLPLSTFGCYLPDVSWLSVYPAEAEILYPPLTYLKYVKTTPIKNSTGFVVEVKPSFST
jgi:hypothetical protein